MPQAYFSLVTTAGKIKLAQSAAGGGPVVITHFGIGDGNGAETNPTPASTTLVHEVWRSAVESVVTDPENPSAILVTAIVPTTAGGWWMREFGVFDQVGTMIAVAKPVSQYKPTAAEGQLEDIRYEFQIIIGETANVALLVDPSLLFATRSWVESRKIPMGQLMRLPWLPVLSMTTTAPPVAPAVGDIYLIPAGATGDWAAKVGLLAEWKSTAWNYITPPNGHGLSLPDGRIFVRIDAAYVEKVALDVQSGKWSYAAAGGTATALTATLSPTPALVDGIMVRLRIASNNTGPVTFNLNGLGVKNVQRSDGSALRKDDLVAGATAILTYNQAGDAWRCAPSMPSDIRKAAFAAPSVVRNTTAGAGTWTVPANVESIDVEGWGGGGGGGYNSSGGVGCPSGGASGGYGRRRFAVTPGQVIPFVVGSGGVGGASSPAREGQPGTATTITVGGVTMTIGGGNGGKNSATVGVVASTAAGGSSTNCDISIDGTAAPLGFGGPTGVAYGGAGASAPLGGAAVAGGSGAPSAGAVPGGGGSASANSSYVGGTGAVGEVRFTYIG